MNPLLQESKTLWIGDIDTWMDESYIGSLFAGAGSVVSVKMIRDKNSGLPSGYGFVEFRDHAAAREILNTYQGKTIPGTNKTFKLNWGVFGGGAKPPGESGGERTGGGGAGGRQGGSRFSSFGNNAQTTQAAEPMQQANKGAAPGPEHSIYVGELDPSVNDQILTEFFQRRYRSVLGSKVIVDPVTKSCKGFGFVKFSDNNEAQAAIREMQGSILRGRALKTSQAYTKNQAQDTGTSNLSNMMNPYAMLANNPLLLNTLGSLSGFGGMQGMAGMQGMQGMAGMGAYGAQYGAYGAGMMGGQMMQGYGQMQGMYGQQAGYGYGTDNMQQQQQQQQGAYQGYQQGYGQQQQQQPQMGGNAFVGSYFDPLNAQQQQQQIQYGVSPGGTYQQYGVQQALTPPPQQQQGYAQDPNQLQQQQQQQQQYNIYPQPQSGPVHVYGQPQTYQGTADGANAENQQSNGTGQQNGQAGEKGNMEEEQNEEAIKYNTTCIGNSFNFDFINSEKMKAVL